MKKNASFTKEYIVDLHDAGPDGKLRISGVMNLFQNTASAHSASLGLSAFKIFSRKLTWMVSRYRVEFERFPSWLDVLGVTTWRSHEEGNFAIREFLVKEKGGDILCRATSSWILLDLETMRPTDPAAAFPDYPRTKKRSIEYDFASLDSLSREEYRRELPVRRHDIDMNRHVNNALFPAFALEALPGDFLRDHTLSAMDISFRGEAKERDTVVSVCEVRRADSVVTRHSLHRGDNEITRLVFEWEEGTV